MIKVDEIEIFNLLTKQVCYVDSTSTSTEQFHFCYWMELFHDRLK
jgi:hypothetical protein